MNRPVCNWVVALKPEAQPLIDHFGFKQEQEFSGGGFPVFENDSRTHRLVISGVGKVNSAAATSWLGQFSNKWDAWINYGIAGNRDAEIGKIFRAGRITDFASGRSWYPNAVWPRKADQFSVTEVLTVDKPTSEYPGAEKTIEMESSGFYPIALRFSSVELVQAIKVISDNEKSDISELKPNLVRQISERAIGEVLDWIPCLEGVCKEEYLRLANPEGWAATCNKFRFSETEKHQLKRQAARAQALGKFSSLADWCEAGEFESGKAILKALEALLANTE